MRFNLKLSHIQFLLAIPMVCLIVFVVALGALLEQANSERRAETHSKEIVLVSNDVSKHLLDVAQSVIALNTFQNPIVYNKFKESLSVTKTGIANLKTLTANDKDKRKRMKRISALGDKALSFIETYGENAYAGNTGATFTVFKTELKAAYNPFISELHELAEQEKKLTANAEINERQRTKKLNTFLTIGVSIILLCMFCASMYIKWIIGRLRLMMSNAKLLARKEPLHSPVRGSDEIAELDGVFHEMAEALLAAEQRKQEFISTTCHDLRSPLANIQVSLALAAKGKYGELNDRGVERFAKAEQSIDRLIQLLNELLDAEKMEAGILELELEEFDLSDAIETSVDSVKTLADNSRVSLNVKETSGCKVNADKARLIRVIVNLLSNAIKFSPAGTDVTVSVQKEGTVYDVRITDQGRGIAPEDREKIFDRFHRVSENTGPSGIGLGLTICKKIIEAHGGSIGVDSTVGSGSTFWFRLNAS